MKFSIEKVLQNFPKINIGVLTGTNLSITPRHPDLQKQKTTLLDETRNKFKGQTPTKHPFIASWREMYRSFGTKPADYRPSAEALIRRGLKTGRIPTINTAVDSYNIVSMRWVIPLGGFDIELVDGDITLRLSDGGEEFMPLGTKKYENTYKGEVVYADNSRILTRRWNYRDCDETKITLDTKKLIMFVDGSPEIPLNIIQSALEDLQNTLSRYCGGSYNIEIANREKSTIIIL